VVNLFSFGGMPAEVAQRALDVYAEQVLPRLRAIDPHRDVGLSAATQNAGAQNAGAQSAGVQSA
jgi:hypothetical protein